MRDMESGYTFDIRDQVTNQYLGSDDEIKTKSTILNLMSLTDSLSKFGFLHYYHV